MLTVAKLLADLPYLPIAILYEHHQVESTVYEHHIYIDAQLFSNSKLWI